MEPWGTPHVIFTYRHKIVPVFQTGVKPVSYCTRWTEPPFISSSRHLKWTNLFPYVRRQERCLRTNSTQLQLQLVALVGEVTSARWTISVLMSQVDWPLSHCTRPPHVPGPSSCLHIHLLTSPPTDSCSSCPSSAAWSLFPLLLSN